MMARQVKVSDEAYDYLKGFKRISKRSMTSIIDMLVFQEPPRKGKKSTNI